MACSKKNCNLKGNDIYICCWICENEYHFKCVGVPARVADSLSEKIGVSWSCEHCRSANLEFLKLFRQCRASFTEVSKDLACVQAKLAKYEDAFKTFSVLGPSESNPIRKMTLRSDSKFKNKSCDKQPLTIPSVGSIVSIEDTVGFDVNNIDRDASLTLPPNLPVSNNINRDLVVVSPKKTIFLSRFALDTSENDVLLFIKNKISGLNDIVVNKFKFSMPRKVSTFKVYVPIEFFDRIVDSTFWPPNTIVHEFIQKNKKPNNINIVTLPKN